MEHPFINRNELGELSLEQLQTKITDLMNKLSFAHSTGNRPLINQLHMVIESYRNQASRKMDELLEKQNIKTNVNIQKEGKIGN